ncbi:CBS domain-containing protein [Chromobacterium piscinae]|uniref:CBS domain-containing protein n=1 Tax=Chromobacterium piscinae TaxID=686831 RepID=UPI00140D3D13|nr:CBS domain-containing protein [Chromobacterium piscinae]MBX9295338.1 CBS domain-containing protein [Chromobacterium vaccinii]MBX9349902.1 CBS domain-containing protein [Chromobacterium vaccinii]MBX9357345.1 CBS domain-containing protein [Chromobacterium vaccinii]MCD4503580.1 CBS domain-containing protein [Chromobacterium piscinae]MCD5330205.1 CBS domain-containing protein [Chromobacterium piscinae]
MQTVKQFLESKPNRALVYVTPDSTVFQALQVMAENDIGAVLVMESGDIVGIFSERDYARRIVLQGRTSAGTKVRDIMTSRVVYVTPSQTLDECRALMTEKRIRHLPVMEDQTVLGILSIGDLVRATIEEQEQVINHLVHYIQSA